MTMPDYSVIIPVYNVEPYLRQCVDSILAQTYGNFELFLVDDGSPDSCGAICDEYAAKDGRITVLHQENKGVTAARRAALDRANADYICFVDGDDTVSPDWLETLERAAAANGRPDILLFGYRHDYGSGKGREFFSPTPEAGYYDAARMASELWPYMLYDRRKSFYNRLLHGFLWTKVFRRSLLLDHFISDARITIYEDVAMVYECVRAAKDLYICPECLYDYRLRNDSSSLKYNPRFLENIRLGLDYMTDHLGRQAPEMLPQINAYYVMRVIHAGITELYRDQSFMQAVRTFRRGVTAQGLHRRLAATALPPHILVMVSLIRLRLFLPVMLEIRIGQSLIHKKLRLK